MPASNDDWDARRCLKVLQRASFFFIKIPYRCKVQIASRALFGSELCQHRREGSAEGSRVGDQKHEIIQVPGLTAQPHPQRRCSGIILGIIPAMCMPCTTDSESTSDGSLNRALTWEPRYSSEPHHACGYSLEKTQFCRPPRGASFTRVGFRFITLSTSAYH